MYSLVVFKIMTLLLPYQPVEVSEQNLDKFFHAVALVESDMNKYAKNKHSSASSYFQVVDGTFTIMKKRALRQGVIYTEKHISELSYEKQRDLIFIDLYERRGTNIYLKAILQGNKEFALRVYFKFHHTRPDAATIKRAQRIFGEIYEN